MSFQEMQKRASEVRQLYDYYNLKANNKSWTETDLMSGFVGDVGDLSKIIMAKNGLRKIDDVDQKLEHELSDCLWSILVLAEKYEINLEAAFIKTMDELTKQISQD